MKYTYVLRIDCGIDKITSLNNLLKINNESTGNYYWEKILLEEASDTPVRFVDIFLSILEGKYEKLSLIGIQKEDISVWIYYEYEGECNMYLTPEDMKQLGDNGITLCISCWESLTETPQYWAESNLSHLGFATDSYMVQAKLLITFTKVTKITVSL